MANGGGLPGFRGDLSWLHDREGHVGRPYWPEGDLILASLGAQA